MEEKFKKQREREGDIIDMVKERNHEAERRRDKDNENMKETL